jgi:regulator of protease activity HflC (stomatin/prohibitin superfamily)
MKEKLLTPPSGYTMLAVVFAMYVMAVSSFVHAKSAELEVSPGWFVLFGLLLMVLGFFFMIGLFTIAPNQAAILQLFGHYKGTVKETGLRWANPFYTKRKISLRVRNFETNHLKVNDLEGNPIEIAAVVVWNVSDSAEACFQVDNYEDYVRVQSEAALRNLATAYAYDSHEAGNMSLRGSSGTIATHLREEIQERLQVAGVDVREARLSHLAYSPEIAAAMLQRQQASAIVAARSKIVEGAVGMVEMALDMLSQRQVITLDEERKAAMVSNLLVVLCGERSTQPVINAGTLHH